MGFKPDLDDQLVSFSAFTLGLVIWPLKIVPEMTYYVSSGTLNPTHSFGFNYKLKYGMFLNMNDSLLGFKNLGASCEAAAM